MCDTANIPEIRTYNVVRLFLDQASVENHLLHLQLTDKIYGSSSRHGSDGPLWTFPVDRRGCDPPQLHPARTTI